MHPKATEAQPFYGRVRARTSSSEAQLLVARAGKSVGDLSGHIQTFPEAALTLTYLLIFWMTEMCKSDEIVLTVIRSFH